MRKLLVGLCVLFTLNSYSQYDDIYWDNNYYGTTYLTYDHFPNYSARLNFFYGTGIYFTWSLFNYYWYTPYYSWYYPSWNYYSWYYPNYNNWYYNNNYYTYNHHHHRKFKNSNSYFGHRSRMSSNTRSNPTKGKPVNPATTKVVKTYIKPTTTTKVVKTPTKVTHTVKTYNKPKTVQKSNTTYNRPTRSTNTTKVIRHTTYNRPSTTRTYTNKTPTRRPSYSSPKRSTTTRSHSRPAPVRRSSGVRKSPR